MNLKTVNYNAPVEIIEKRETFVMTKKKKKKKKIPYSERRKEKTLIRLEPMTLLNAVIFCAAIWERKKAFKVKLYLVRFY